MKEAKPKAEKRVSCYFRLTREEVEILEKMAKDRFGMNSIYELMQYLGSILATLGDEKRNLSESQAEFLTTFFTPFLEVDNPKEYLWSYKKATDMAEQYTRGHGEIEKAVIIRKGGFIETLSKDEEGKPVVSFSRDDAALDVITAGKPTLRALIQSVMQGNKCFSFVENTRLLYNDVFEDLAKANGLIGGLGYASNTYGIVPKRVKNKTFVE